MRCFPCFRDRISDIQSNTAIKKDTINLQLGTNEGLVQQFAMLILVSLRKILMTALMP